MHTGDDFLSEVAPFGEVDTGVHESGLGGEVGGAEVDVVEGVSGFDSRGVDCEPSGGFELVVFKQALVDGFELVGGDGDGETNFACEVEAIDYQFSVVEWCDGVGVLIDRNRFTGGIEDLEGEGAVD